MNVRLISDTHANEPIELLRRQKKFFQSTPSDLTNLSTILQNLEQFDIKLTPDQFDKLKKSVDGSVSFKFFARNFLVRIFRVRSEFRFLYHVSKWRLSNILGASIIVDDTYISNTRVIFGSTYK